MKTSTRIRLAAVNAIGFSPSTIMPLWLGGIAHALSMPAWFASAAVLGQIGGAAFFNLATPSLFRRAALLPLARGALLVAAMGYLLAAVFEPALFIFGCIVSGSAMGVVLNLTNRLMGSAEHVQKGYAVFVMIEVCFASAVFLACAGLIARFGLFAMFPVVSMSAVVGCFLLKSPSLVHAATTRADGTPPAHRARAIIALIAFATFFLGQATLNAFMPSIGIAAGLKPYVANQAIGFGMFFALLGAALARIVGERVPPVVPIVAVVAVLAALGPLLTLNPSALIFFCSIGALGVSTIFAVPYFFAQLGALDRSGRYTGFGPAMMLGGIALGPSAAVLLNARFGLEAVGFFSSSLLLLGGIGSAVAASPWRVTVSA